MRTAAADPAGARPLLDRADQALQARTAGVFAVTAYRPSGAYPLAWSGVPSEVGVDRIAGPEAFFVAPGPLGLRLVYIKPILDPVSGHRVGVSAAERVVSSSLGVRMATPEGVLSLPTLVPVTVQPDERRSRSAGFVIQSPLGRDPPRACHVACDSDTSTAAAKNVPAVVARSALTLIVSRPRLDFATSFPTLRGHVKAKPRSWWASCWRAGVLWFPANRSMDRPGVHTATLGPGGVSAPNPIDFL